MSEMLDQGKPSLAELAHHGVKGQKWGVRRGKGETGVSRVRGAQIDRNNRIIGEIGKAQAGTAHRRKVALGKKLIGEEAQKENWKTTVNNLNSQNERLKSGKLTIADKATLFNQTNLLDLATTRTPK